MRVRIVTIIAAALVTTGAAATATAGVRAVASPNPSTSYNDLFGVSAVSGSSAWAVGTYTNNTIGVNDTLILHWNGTNWPIQRSPSPSGTANGLGGVSAISGSDAWAAGFYTNSTTGVHHTLILHWNGTGWTQVTSPSPSRGGNDLNGVSTVSGSDAWAVGQYKNNATLAKDTLILHWNGTAWTQVASPSPSPGVNDLYGVSTVSGSDAWAVGDYCSSGCLTPAEIDKTLILHWNGTAWTQVASPSPSATTNHLAGVSAISATDAWAVGYYCSSSCGTRSAINKTLILHWNGTAWSIQPSLNPSTTANGLRGVSAVSGSDVWAVGTYKNDTTSTTDTLILHWNGTAWSKVKSPNPETVFYNELNGVSAVSGSDAWAVGDYLNHTTAVIDTLILHWNGKTWSQK